MIMIDLSESMNRVVKIGGSTQRAGDLGVEWLNMLLAKIYMLAHGDGYELNRYDVAVVGYSGRGVMSMLSRYEEPFIDALELSTLSTEQRWLKVRSISPLDSPDDYVKLAEKDHLVEFYGGKPMFEAYHTVMEWLEKWFNQRTNGAAVVMNISSDSVPTDSSLNAIVGISNHIGTIVKGDVMMLNMVLSDKLDSRHCSLFPTDDELYYNPSTLFRTLGEASSSLKGVEAALPLIHKFRGESSNGDYRAVVGNMSLIDLLPILTSKK